MGPQKKKLMPKSAFLVKKYKRAIRVSFATLIILLTFMFVMDAPSSSSKTPRNSTGSTAYKMPTTDVSQNVHYPKEDSTKEKGVFVTLARNSNLWELVLSIRHVEDRFNNRYHYDWVFLNDEEFTDEFKRVTSALTSGKAKFGLIPKEQWSVPSWIDEEKFDAAREEMARKKVIYGGSIPYRHMCRFNSGFFYRHELLEEYEWYWRVDTDITLFCDIQYDIFKFMKENKKKYGFIISLTEYQTTIPTLWSTTKKFIEENPQYVKENNLMDFISDDGGRTYSGCHFWSNFEVGSLEFWRSEAYTKYFDYLDQNGGFFYERWGDAPVHSIAAALFLDRSEVHFFDGIGFHHEPFTSCPVEEDIRIQNKCTCKPQEDKTWLPSYFCTRKFFEVTGLKMPPGV